MASPASPLISVLIALAAGLTTGAAIGVAVQSSASSEWKQRWQEDTAALTARAQRAESAFVAEQQKVGTAVNEATRLKAVVVEQAREIEVLRIAAEPRFADVDADIAPPLPTGVR